MFFIKYCQAADSERISYTIGSTGITLSEGPKGETGLIGLPGRMGEKGELGLKGNNGYKGNLGPIGPPGIKGDTGNLGNTGVRGYPGNLGNKGETGNVGSTGITGPPGNDGQIIKGDKGSCGRFSLAINNVDDLKAVILEIVRGNMLPSSIIYEFQSNICEFFLKIFLTNDTDNFGKYGI